MKSIKKWFQGNRKIILFIAIVFFAWQLLIAVLAGLGHEYFPTSRKYLFLDSVGSPPSLWSRANFDGIHYLDIARKGYGLHEQAFFPLYPKLIKFLTPVFSNQNLLAGLMISWLSLAGALFFLYKLIRLDWDDETAQRAIIYLLIFPASFFFSAVYTESLFLFLVVTSFYFARTKRWLLAGILGAFASATTLTGVFLWPALIFEFYQQYQKGIMNKRKLAAVLNKGFPLLLIPLGLIIYMIFLKVNYNDSLLFVHAQPYFGAGRTGGKIILLYQVFWRYLKMLITVDKITPTYFVLILESLTGGFFLLLTIFVYLRRWYSYLTFMLLVYITPTLTGTLSSMPRYVLVLFPGFILLALWAKKYRWMSILYPIISTFLLVLSLWLFTRGHWVA